MTRAEVIRSTAKICGVPDSEAKVFFEMLLSMISKKLHAGDKLKINNIGSLQYRQAKVRNFNPGTSKEQEFILRKVVIFSPSDSESTGVKDQILFNVPAMEEEDQFQSPDYHFSLSIGKPVIPLKGLRHSEFFVPPSGQELRHLLYSKAERLIQNSEIVEGKEGEDQIVILPGNQNQNRAEFNDNIKILDSGKKKDSWETEDVSKQIQEDSILDLDKGDQPVAEPSLKEIVEKNKKALAEKEKQESSSPHSEGAGQKLISKRIDESGKFERVKTVAKRIAGETENYQPSDELSKKNESGPEFVPVKKTGFSPDKESFVVPDEKVPEIKKHQDKIKNKHRRRPANEENYEEKSISRRRTKAGIIVLFVILIFSIAAAVLIYSPLFNHDDKTETRLLTNSPVIPVITERNYDLPVTYPYDNTMNNAGFYFEPIAIIPSENQAQNEDAAVQEENVTGNKPDPGLSNELSGVVPVKVKENIFRYKEVFVVQVSSWKSKSKAESEVTRYTGKGYYAFLEPATDTGQSTYYRVRVGNFNSIIEAEDFLKKNI